MKKCKYLLNNKTFGQLKVIKLVSGKYLCICSCGNERYILTTDLLNGKYKSCGCRRRISDISYEERFRKRYFKFTVENENGCLEWIGAHTKEGYGHISYKAKSKRATRIMWEWNYGTIPKKMLICHHCDNPKCVNIKHLFLGTNATNSQDKVAKNRCNPRKGENHPSSKLNIEKARKIKDLFAKGVSFVKIAEEFCVGISTIRRIKNGLTWKEA